MSESPTTALYVSVAMDTNIGRKRKQNQDAIGQMVPTDPDVLDELGQLLVLADGVGGLKGGDLASQYAVSTIISSYYEQEKGEPPDRLARAIAEANNVIYAEGQGQEPPAMMATTVVAAVVRGRDLVIGSVGDSPAYLMRHAQARKLTLDHTVETMQEEAGVSLPDGDPDGRKLVRALGSAPSVKVDIITGRVRGGDHVVLCSDGLTRYVTPQEIEEMVATLAIEHAVKTLIDLANERGGTDNISVIVLRLSEDETMAKLPPITDPLEEWGLPRRAERTRLVQPTVRVPPAEAKRPGKAAPPADNPLLDLWQFLRSNTLLTAAGMSVLLVIFAVVMLIIASAGGENKPSTPAATPVPPQDKTATVGAFATATVQVAAALTNDAILDATAAEVARRTLTPPTPIPTSGPQMTDGIWFRVLPGDPIPAYSGSSLDSEQATDLEAGQNYRVTGVTHEADNGPWYQVIDNLGQEARWVNGPSLHQRIVVIDTSGNPLPSDQQPVDVPPPSEANFTPTPAPSSTPLSTVPGTPGTPVTPPPPTATSQPSITYGVENWTVGTSVALKDDLTLCRIPDVTACDAGDARQGESGTIVGGPIPSGEHWWWEVEFQDGRSGWIAQVLLGAP
ncbi:MAG TPA: protein phosphatase 2C domain-containing protein [Aggregatilineaceae bacterium]|nr:protein phosphatase 2C domain-containing protein [Aggregatilineaceae bacterium]